MAQNIKSMAARMADNQSYNFSDFIARIKKDEDGYTKGDLIKATLWYAWYKTVDFLAEWIPRIGEFIKIIFMVIIFVLLQVVLLAVFIAVGIPAGITGLLTMPIWFPIMIALAPKRASDILYNWNTPVDNEEILLGIIAWYAWGNFLFCIIGQAVFGWIANFLPMSRRKYFMDKQDMSLKSYDAGTQIAYVMAFETENERKNAISNMSYQSVEKLWADKPEMHSLILAKWMLCEKWARELLRSNEEVDWKLLVATAYDADKKIGDDVLNYFIDKMKDPEIGTKARKVFSVYGQKHTLSTAVLQELIDVAGKGNENAQKALVHYAKREALSSELLNEVYGTKDEALIKEMQGIAKMHADIDIVRDTQDNDPEKNQWRQFCQLENHIDSEAQKLMNRSQYSIYKATGHKLDREALRYLLMVQCDDGYSRSFFKELIEGEFEQIDEQLKAQICTQVWRQKVYYQVASARKAEVEAS